MQEKYALSSLPVWKASYDNPAVVKTNPAVVPQAKKQLADLILRPQVEATTRSPRRCRPRSRRRCSGSKSAAAGAERRRGPGRDPPGCHERGPSRDGPSEEGAGPGASGVQGEARFAVALLLPAAIVVFGVVLYPVARTFVISLFDVDSPLPGSYPFVGLSNYVRVFRDPAFYPRRSATPSTSRCCPPRRSWSSASPSPCC